MNRQKRVMFEDIIGIIEPMIEKNYEKGINYSVSDEAHNISKCITFELLERGYSIPEHYFDYFDSALNAEKNKDRNEEIERLKKIFYAYSEEEYIEMLDYIYNLDDDEGKILYNKIMKELTKKKEK